MANTYTLISSNTLSSSAASVTFSSIPSTYTDLVLRVSARSDSNDGGSTGSLTALYFYVNGGAGTGSGTRLTGNGAAASSDRWTDYGKIFPQTDSSLTTNTFSNIEIYIPSYTASQNKPYSSFSVAENNATTAYVGVNAGLYPSTTSISSLVLYPWNGNFVSGSSFYLYGIKKS
jgi:hypothetical protein